MMHYAHCAEVAASPACDVRLQADPSAGPIHVAPQHGAEGIGGLVDVVRLRVNKGTRTMAEAVKFLKF